LLIIARRVGTVAGSGHVPDFHRPTRWAGNEIRRVASPPSPATDTQNPQQRVSFGKSFAPVEAEYLARTAT